jgi:precorrin-6Y C5,15-methyltransferase (decarboxylating)
MSAEPLTSPMHEPWLSVVGIGEDGVEGLGEEAKRRIAAAEFVFGGRRHLALVAGLVRGELRPWPSPFDTAMTGVTALRGRRVCVLASGDPFLHGVGATLARIVPAGEMATCPAPSSLSLAAARLGWPLHDVETISLHGRPIEGLRPLLHPGVRILALTSDGDGPAVIAAMLASDGFGPSRLTVMEALSGPSERVRSSRAEGFDIDNVNPLNVLAIEVDSTPEARILPLSPGIDDDLYEHDGQLTRREMRALTMSALAPRRGELLWDIGAGSGSIAIEWLLRHPSMRAIAVERQPERAHRAARNALAFGVPSLQVVEGEAPAALSALPRPDTIFIGGGGSEAGVMEAAIAALKPGGRLVANAVTLEMEGLLLARHAAVGGDLLRLSIARASPVGTMHAWRPAMPLLQWTWVKP